MRFLAPLQINPTYYEVSSKIFLSNFNYLKLFIYTDKYLSA